MLKKGKYLHPSKQQSALIAPSDNRAKSLMSSVKNVLNKKISIIVISCLIFLAGVFTGAFFWFQNSLKPLNASDTQQKTVIISSNNTPGQISEQLESQSIIRSSFAFDIYVRLSGSGNKLKAGNYRLSPSQTVPQIVDMLVGGSVATFNITFLPGATLAENIKVFKKAGYSDDQINTALNKTYTTADSLLFKDKPVGTDLEGYIFGETYNFNYGATVGEILRRTFDEYYSQIVDNNLLEGFSDQGLNLYEAITLASIIQREDGDAATQPQVAQVFYLRLSIDMVLGSDVTYQYIADKTGVERDPNLDSPYNTRINKGLPPGPIATPGLSALKAVAKPASGEYLYFLSGDDNVMYFSYTYEEHQQNIIDHCAEKCAIS